MDGLGTFPTGTTLKVPQDRMDSLERSQQVPLSLGKSQLSIPSRRTMGQDGRFRNVLNRYHSHWVNPNCQSHPIVPWDRMDGLGMFPTGTTLTG